MVIHDSTLAIFFSMKYLILTILFLPFVAHANVAPLRIPGQTLVPLEAGSARNTSTDDIRMVSEEVTLDVHLLDKIVEQSSKTTDGYIRGRSQVTVIANFTLANESEFRRSNFVMGFPYQTGLLQDAQSEEEERNFAALQNLHVLIDGEPATFETVVIDEDKQDSFDGERWATWTVDFGEKGSEHAVREIKVSYDILSSDWYFTELASIENLPEGIYDSAAFYYILHTGSGWKDTIGKTTVRMRFPKDIEFVQREFETWGGDENARAWSISPAEYEVDDEKHEITWQMNDWEPEFSSDANPNILVEFMYPETVKIFTDHFPIVSTAALTSSVNDPEKKETVQDVSSNESLSTLWIVSSGTVVLVVFGVVATVRKSKKK